MRRQSPFGKSWQDDDTGRIWLFRFGAVVLEAQGDAREAVLRELERLSGRSPLLRTEDRWSVREDATSDGAQPRAGWDEIVLPRMSDASLDAIAMLLGQSAALERYEEGANELVEETLEIALALSTRARPPRGDRALVRQLGMILVRRLELARLFFLVDQPDVTWEDRDVSALYSVLFLQLELRERHLAVLHKLEAVKSAADSTFSILHSRRSNMLEVWIVILIVAEIVLFLGGLA